MNTHIIIIAAEDGGFGNHKIGWLNGDGNIHTTALPADVGIGSTELGLLSAGTDRKYTQVKPFTVEWEGHRFLVGPNVHRWSSRTFERRTDYQRLGNAPEARPLTYVGLAQMLNSIAEARAQAGPHTTANGHKPVNLPVIQPDDDPTPHVSLVVGFPVEVMEDVPRAQSILAGRKSWLIGCHHFTVNGRPYRVHVDRLVAMPQPFGTYGWWGYRPDGTWGRPKEDFNVPVCVGDVGYNTFDMYGIERGEIVGHLARGQDLGIHHAVQTIVQEVRAAHGVELSNGEADQMIREHTKGRAVTIHTSKASYEINHIVQQGLDLCFNGLSTFMREHVRPGDYRYLLLTGGGLLSLRQQFINQYPRAHIPPDPVTSNVDGLARRAQWYYTKKSPMPAA